MLAVWAKYSLTLLHGMRLQVASDLSINNYEPKNQIQFFSGVFFYSVYCQLRAQSQGGEWTWMR